MAMLNLDQIKAKYPIHWMVWNNDDDELRRTLENNQFTSEEIELKDPRGRTPLLLAVTLNRLDAVKALIEAGADVNCEKDGWSAVQEATVTGNRELLAIVLANRDYQRSLLRTKGVPELLNKLSMAPDFYVEMKWEFTSWVPLVSRMCPFDTYKVYKRGANVRVDTTLVGFENNRWQRGDRTYIFTRRGDGASLVELDHAAGTSWHETLSTEDSTLPAPSQHSLDHRLAQPVAINYLDTDNISIERNKCGIWGWRQDKTETVNGYECRVFSANNVELVSRTRCEHVQGVRSPSPRAPLAGLLALAEDQPAPTETETPSPSEEKEKEQPITPEEYFSDVPMYRDIGRPKQLSTKVQKFKATLWLCENYPLELQEQIMPILDLMATMSSSPHFAKLKDFVQLQLPAGFPVKIEIPLFHVLNARITFGNIFGMDTAVPNVQCIPEGTKFACIIDDACFNIPAHYKDTTKIDLRACTTDDEESLLQYAIQQSLMEAGTDDEQVDVWEALRGARPSTPSPNEDSPTIDHEERQLQRAIEESLTALNLDHQPSPQWESLSLDQDLQAALELSAQEHSKFEMERLAEQRALDEAIRLSQLDQ